MRFKKFGNFKHLIYTVILSFILSYIFLIIGIDIKASYLLANCISMILFVILSIIYKNKVLKKHHVQGVIKECIYSYLSNCDLTYEFSYNGKTKNAIYSYSGVEPVGKVENLYILDEEKIIRESDITLFKNKGLTIFSLVAVLFMFVGIKEFNIANVELDLAGENFGKIFLFKTFNVFLIFFAIILIGIYNKLRMKKKTVKGILVNYINHVDEETTENGLTQKMNYYSSVFEYNWNGEKKEYICPTSSSSFKLGTIKKLYIDENGIVVGEQSEIIILLVFGIALLLFYLIGLFAIII